MRAAVGFIQSIVVATLLYGAISFIGMNKQQVKTFEKIMKDAIYDILELSTYANYNAVLAEIGVLRAEEVLKLRKMSFINKLMHTREKCNKAIKSLHKLMGIFRPLFKHKCIYLFVCT